VRGLFRLATQGVEGVTRIVEGVHQSVWSTLGVAGGKRPGQAGGLTGLVYKTVRGLTRFIGGAADIALGGLEPYFGSAGDAEIPAPGRESILAILNGVMGDRLLADDNPFATLMTLRHSGQALNMQAPAAIPAATGKILVLIHGLCMNDLQWRTKRDGHVVDYGETLAASLGYTPVSVRYNSGLHISKNGFDVSVQLEKLVAQWPKPVEELAVVAHSMGGLVIRSALHAAGQEKLHWPGCLKNMVFLGTPHHGAPLEQAGNWVDVILGSTAYTAPFARLGHLRSSGITDLRHGHLLDEDWQGHDRFQRAPDTRRIVPLPEGVACFTVAATTASEPGFLADRLVGDGLVPVDSALGRHGDAPRDLGFAAEAQKIEYGMNHLGLLSSPDVARQMVRWLTPDPT